MPHQQALPNILIDKRIMLDATNNLHANGSIKPARKSLNFPPNIWIPFNTLTPSQKHLVLTILFSS